MKHCSVVLHRLEEKLQEIEACLKLNILLRRKTQFRNWLGDTFRIEDDLLDDDMLFANMCRFAEELAGKIDDITQSPFEEVIEKQMAASIWARDNIEHYMRAIKGKPISLSIFAAARIGELPLVS